MRTKILLSVILISVCSTASAQLYTIKQYQANKNAEWMVTYVSGVGAGIMSATVWNKAAGLPLAWCPPKKLALNKNNYVQILEDGIKLSLERGMGVDTPMEPLLLAGLQKAFPCTKENDYGLLH